MITSALAILTGLLTGAFLKKLGFHKAAAWIFWIIFRFWWINIPITALIAYVLIFQSSHALAIFSTIGFMVMVIAAMLLGLGLCYLIYQGMKIVMEASVKANGRCGGLWTDCHTWDIAYVPRDHDKNGHGPKCPKFTKAKEKRFYRPL